MRSGDLGFCPIYEYGAITSVPRSWASVTGARSAQTLLAFVWPTPGGVMSHAAARRESDTETTGSTRPVPISPGTSVEVRVRFDGRWCGGFEVADRIETDSDPVAYRLRRLSDGAVLPVLFSADDISVSGGAPTGTP